jgi:flagellar biosynthesis protein
VNRRQLQAIAIEYGLNDAPVVTARGVDDVAERIIAEAKAHGVMIADNPQLLAMLRDVPLDQEIPPSLYAAVAVVLSWVYWLKGMQPGDEKTR